MEGARPGFDFGIGAGALFDLGSVHLRVDLMAQFYVINFYKLDLSGAGSSSTLSEDLRGIRYFVMAGVEL